LVIKLGNYIQVETNYFKKNYLKIQTLYAINITSTYATSESKAAITIPSPIFKFLFQFVFLTIKNDQKGLGIALFGKE